MRRLAGVVLTGGSSSRMGTDKALLDVDGRPMAVRIADALWEAGCHPVWCQGGDLAALAALGLDAVADSTPGAGPLAAIATALVHADGVDVVVAACDLVGLDSATIAALVEASRRDTADVVVAHAGGRDHLVAWWSAATTGPVSELVGGGTRSLRDALAALSVVRVEVDPVAVRNANRPDDLG